MKPIDMSLEPPQPPMVPKTMYALRRNVENYEGFMVWPKEAFVGEVPCEVIVYRLYGVVRIMPDGSIEKVSTNDKMDDKD
jgi:ribosome-associated toxin RatA of RatAB toxin-antitoxin module